MKARNEEIKAPAILFKGDILANISSMKPTRNAGRDEANNPKKKLEKPNSIKTHIKKPVKIEIPAMRGLGAL